ncbi:FHA domain-containing protein [Labrys sp. KB_33_2]|uniref:FHA domain-containing protein n=1 Tax=Labrys sp. KB_33_2 TaxID=3237479 RepID=UPI003F91DF7D
MRLELKQVEESGTRAGGQRWVLERGRRTLGRSVDCDWQVPDAGRTLSKHHCTILRDRDGYLLRDESANGTRVDGILVLEGETARLRHQSRLELGGQAFSVSVTGEADRDIVDPAAGLAVSEENLTITAILADIAPGGQTATGVMGGRVSDDWPLQQANASRPAGRKAEAAPSSRHVEIGWNGPPDPKAIKPVLPNDWNEDFDYGNRLEHGRATFVSVPMARDRGKSGSEAAPANDDTTQAIPSSDRDEDPAEFLADLTPVFAWQPRCEGLLAQCEETLEKAFATFEIGTESLAETPDLFGLDREEAMLARLETLLTRQQALAEALGTLVREVSPQLEPRIIEASTDARTIGLPWRRNGAYWQTYRRQFNADGRDLSVRDLFRRAMLSSLGQVRNEPAGGQTPRTADGTTSKDDEVA